MRQVRARCEVLLAGGSINSPRLLQLSGVGSVELLRIHGIVVAPGLGSLWLLCPAGGAASLVFPRL